MNKFIENHLSDIIYIVVVIVILVMLYFLTDTLLKWISRKITGKLPRMSPKPIHIIKRILTVLWLVLAIIAISFIFIDLEKQAVFIRYFKQFSYVGIVSISSIIAINLCNFWFKHNIRRKTEEGEDPTAYNFLRYIALSFIGLIGLVLITQAFPMFKSIGQTALGGAGVLALIVGFAAQEALANVTGGLFIISFKPFRIGDRIKVSDAMVGTVIDVTLRHTILRNSENKMIVIPNAIINKEKLINFDLDDKRICERIEIEISYDSDIDLAKKIMREECENHALILDNRSILDKEIGKPIVRTALISLNDTSITIRAWAWVSNNSNAYALRYDVLESIKKRFDKEGIEIPYPYRTIVMKKEA